MVSLPHAAVNPADGGDRRMHRETKDGRETTGLLHYTQTGECEGKGCEDINTDTLRA